MPHKCTFAFPTARLHAPRVGEKDKHTTVKSEYGKARPGVREALAYIHLHRLLRGLQFSELDIYLDLYFSL